MKKLLILILSMFPLMAMAETIDATIDGVSYRIETTKRTATVIHGDYKGTVTIPAYFDFAQMRIKVTCILPEAFANKNEVTDIYCFASCVPHIDGVIVDDTAIGNITVRVPALAVPYYQKVNGWRSFKAISPMTDYEGDPSEIGTYANEKLTPRDKIDIHIKNPVTGK